MSTSVNTNASLSASFAASKGGLSTAAKPFVPPSSPTAPPSSEIDSAIGNPSAVSRPNQPKKDEVAGSMTSTFTVSSLNAKPFVPPSSSSSSPVVAAPQGSSSFIVISGGLKVQEHIGTTTSTSTSTTSVRGNSGHPHAQPTSPTIQQISSGATDSLPASIAQRDQRVLQKLASKAARAERKAHKKAMQVLQHHQHQQQTGAGKPLPHGLYFPPQLQQHSGPDSCPATDPSLITMSVTSVGGVGVAVGGASQFFTSTLPSAAQVVGAAAYVPTSSSTSSFVVTTGTAPQNTNTNSNQTLRTSSAAASVTSMLANAAATLQRMSVNSPTAHTNTMSSNFVVTSGSGTKNSGSWKGSATNASTTLINNPAQLPPSSSSFVVSVGGAHGGVAPYVQHVFVPSQQGSMSSVPSMPISVGGQHPTQQSQHHPLSLTSAGNHRTLSSTTGGASFFHHGTSSTKQPSASGASATAVSSTSAALMMSSSSSSTLQTNMSATHGHHQHPAQHPVPTATYLIPLPITGGTATSVAPRETLPARPLSNLNQPPKANRSAPEAKPAMRTCNYDPFEPSQGSSDDGLLLPKRKRVVVVFKKKKVNARQQQKGAAEDNLISKEIAPFVVEEKESENEPKKDGEDAENEELEEVEELVDVESSSDSEEDDGEENCYNNTLRSDAGKDEAVVGAETKPSAEDANETKSVLFERFPFLRNKEWSERDKDFFRHHINYYKFDFEHALSELLELRGFTLSSADNSSEKEKGDNSDAAEGVPQELSGSVMIAKLKNALKNKFVFSTKEWETIANDFFGNSCHISTSANTSPTSPTPATSSSLSAAAAYGGLSADDPERPYGRVRYPVTPLDVPPTLLTALALNAGKSSASNASITDVTVASGLGKQAPLDAASQPPTVATALPNPQQQPTTADEGPGYNNVFVHLANSWPAHDDCRALLSRLLRQLFVAYGLGGREAVTLYGPLKRYLSKCQSPPAQGTAAAVSTHHRVAAEALRQQKANPSAYVRRFDQLYGLGPVGKHLNQAAPLSVVVGVGSSAVVVAGGSSASSPLSPRTVGAARPRRQLTFTSCAEVFLRACDEPRLRLKGQQRDEGANADGQYNTFATGLMTPPPQMCSANASTSSPSVLFGAGNNTLIALSTPRAATACPSSRAVSPSLVRSFSSSPILSSRPPAQRMPSHLSREWATPHAYLQHVMSCIENGYDVMGPSGFYHLSLVNDDGLIVLDENFDFDDEDDEDETEISATETVSQKVKKHMMEVGLSEDSKALLREAYLGPRAHHNYYSTANSSSATTPREMRSAPPSEQLVASPLSTTDDTRLANLSTVTAVIEGNLPAIIERRLAKNPTLSRSLAVRAALLKRYNAIPPFVAVPQTRPRCAAATANPSATTGDGGTTSNTANVAASATMNPLSSEAATKALHSNGVLSGITATFSALNLKRHASKHNLERFVNPPTPTTAAVIEEIKAMLTALRDDTLTSPSPSASPFPGGSPAKEKDEKLKTQGEGRENELDGGDSSGRDRGVVAVPSSAAAVSIIPSVATTTTTEAENKEAEDGGETEEAHEKHHHEEQTLKEEKLDEEEIFPDEQDLASIARDKAALFELQVLLPTATRLGFYRAVKRRDIVLHSPSALDAVRSKLTTILSRVGLTPEEARQLSDEDIAAWESLGNRVLLAEPLICEVDRSRIPEEEFLSLRAKKERLIAEGSLHAFDEEISIGLEPYSSGGLPSSAAGSPTSRNAADKSEQSPTHSQHASISETPDDGTDGGTGSTAATTASQTTKDGAIITKDGSKRRLVLSPYLPPPPPAEESLYGTALYGITQYVPYFSEISQEVVLAMRREKKKERSVATIAATTTTADAVVESASTSEKDSDPETNARLRQRLLGDSSVSLGSFLRPNTVCVGMFTLENVLLLLDCESDDEEGEEVGEKQSKEKKASAPQIVSAEKTGDTTSNYDESNDKPTKESALSDSEPTRTTTTTSTAAASQPISITQRELLKFRRRHLASDLLQIVGHVMQREGALMGLNLKRDVLEKILFVDATIVRRGGRRTTESSGDRSGTPAEQTRGPSLTLSSPSSSSPSSSACTCIVEVRISFLKRSCWPPEVEERINDGFFFTPPPTNPNKPLSVPPSMTTIPAASANPLDECSRLLNSVHALYCYTAAASNYATTVAASASAAAENKAPAASTSSSTPQLSFTDIWMYRYFGRFVDSMQKGRIAVVMDLNGYHITLPPAASIANTPGTVVTVLGSNSSTNLEKELLVKSHNNNNSTNTNTNNNNNNNGGSSGGVQVVVASTKDKLEGAPATKTMKVLNEARRRGDIPTSLNLNAPAVLLSSSSSSSSSATGADSRHDEQSNVSHQTALVVSVPHPTGISITSCYVVIGADHSRLAPQDKLKNVNRSEEQAQQQQQGEDAQTSVKSDGPSASDLDLLAIDIDITFTPFDPYLVGAPTGPAPTIAYGLVALTLGTGRPKKPTPMNVAAKAFVPPTSTPSSPAGSGANLHFMNPSMGSAATSMLRISNSANGSSSGLLMAVPTTVNQSKGTRREQRMQRKEEKKRAAVAMSTTSGGSNTTEVATPTSAPTVDPAIVAAGGPYYPSSFATTHAVPTTLAPIVVDVSSFAVGVARLQPQQQQQQQPQVSSGSSLSFTVTSSSSPPQQQQKESTQSLHLPATSALSSSSSFVVVGGTGLPNSNSSVPVASKVAIEITKSRYVLKEEAQQQLRSPRTRYGVMGGVGGECMRVGGAYPTTTAAAPTTTGGYLALSPQQHQYPQIAAMNAGGYPQPQNPLQQQHQHQHVAQPVVASALAAPPTTVVVGGQGHNPQPYYPYVSYLSTHDPSAVYAMAATVPPQQAAVVGVVDPIHQHQLLLAQQQQQQQQYAAMMGQQHQFVFQQQQHQQQQFVVMANAQQQQRPASPQHEKEISTPGDRDRSQQKHIADHPTQEEPAASYPTKQNEMLADRSEQSAKGDEERTAAQAAAATATSTAQREETPCAGVSGSQHSLSAGRSPAMCPSVPLSPPSSGTYPHIPTPTPSSLVMPPSAATSTATPTIPTMAEISNKSTAANVAVPSHSPALSATSVTSLGAAQRGGGQGGVTQATVAAERQAQAQQQQQQQQAVADYSLQYQQYHQQQQLLQHQQQMMMMQQQYHCVYYGAGGPPTTTATPAQPATAAVAAALPHQHVALQQQQQQYIHQQYMQPAVAYALPQQQQMAPAQQGTGSGNGSVGNSFVGYPNQSQQQQQQQQHSSYPHQHQLQQQHVVYSHLAQQQQQPQQQQVSLTMAPSSQQQVTMQGLSALSSDLYRVQQQQQQYLQQQQQQYAHHYQQLQLQQHQQQLLLQQQQKQQAGQQNATNSRSGVYPQPSHNVQQQQYQHPQPQQANSNPPQSTASSSSAHYSMFSGLAYNGGNGNSAYSTHSLGGQIASSFFPQQQFSSTSNNNTAARPSTLNYGDDDDEDKRIAVAEEEMIQSILKGVL